MKIINNTFTLCKGLPIRHIYLMFILFLLSTNVVVAETLYGVTDTPPDEISTQSTGGYGGVHLSWRYSTNFTVGSPVYVDCQGTHVDDERSFTCYWDFGDGQIVSGDSATHTYSSTGIYTLNVSACIDGQPFNNTNCAYDFATVEIYLNPPSDSVEVNPRGPYYGIAGAAVTFKADYILWADYDWEFGDGTSKSGREVTHTYSEPGIYQVTLKVRDITNKVIGYASTTAEISSPPPNQAPTARIAPINTVISGESVTFDGGNSSDPEGGQLTYVWRFSDMEGKTITGRKVVHTFYTAGSYNVTLWVNDGGLDSIPVSIPVTVSQNPNEESLVSYCNSVTAQYGSQIHSNFVNPENGAWIGSSYLGLNSGITTAFTKRIHACSTGSIYGQAEFNGLCSYQCYTVGSGVYCDKFDSEGALTSSSVYMGTTSYVTSGIANEVIVGCSASIPSAPALPNMCYLSCYTTGSQVRCDKKTFSGQVVSQGYYGGTWAITPNAGHNQIVSCN